MGLEGRIKSYVERKNWDIVYKDTGTVKNVFGQAFSIDIEHPEGCSSFYLGRTIPIKSEIKLTAPCDKNIENSVAESREEYMAHVLAHELGHADSYPVVAPVGAVIIAYGLKKSLEKLSFKPLLVGIGLGYFALGELAADVCATVFHDVPFMGGYYVQLPDLAAYVEKITDLF